MPDSSALESVIEQTLRVVWYYGDVAKVTAHATGWISSGSTGLIQVLGQRTRIEQRDQPPCWAEDGMAMVTSANVAYSLESTLTGARNGVCRYASIDFLAFGGIDVLSLYEVPLLIAKPRAQVIGDICEEFVALHHAPPPTAIARVASRSALGLRLLAVLLRDAPTNERGASLLLHSDRMQPVLRWIDESLHLPANLASLARTSGLSPSRFHALFRQVMRQSPMAYLSRRRIQRAQQLLMTTDRAVQDIGKAVGIPDAFRFSKVFKRTTGYSPMQYRQRAGLWLTPERLQSTPTTADVRPYDDKSSER